MHRRALGAEWNQEVTGRCVSDIVQWQQRAEEQLQLFTRWFHHSYRASWLSLSLFLSLQFWICQDFEMPLWCAAPLFTHHLLTMLNFASHLTRMQDSVLQSVTLWCGDVILKFPFIALFLISCFPAGLIGSHNEVIQLYSMDLQHIKLCVYSLPWNVWLDVHFKSMLCCWFLIAWKATGTRWPWGGVREWNRHLAVGGATNLGKALLRYWCPFWHHNRMGLFPEFQNDVL